jgi:DNA modification methylase
MEPYYQDEAVTIYHGDCREVLPSLSGIDLVLTSPPYNKGINSDGRELSADERVGHYKKTGRLNERGGHGLWKRNTLSEGYGSHDDAMPWAAYCDQQKTILALCWATLTDVGAIFYNHKPRIFNLDLWIPTELNPGLPLRQIVIWARNSGFNFSPTDVWQIPPELNTPHPAPFPLKLATRAIETSAANRILDPYMGSGTTLRAAKDLGRKAIGIEIEEKYCEIAAKRMSQEVFDFTQVASEQKGHERSASEGLSLLT